MLTAQKKYAVSIKRDIKVPMRDGVLLSADIYMPVTDVPVPGIVVRTPYLKTSNTTHENGTYFAEQGFATMYMDVRGRGDSEGEFHAYFQDANDGYDTIQWMAEQEWCDGKIGTMGGSYLARIQWLAALKQPPNLKAMISTVSPSDPFVEWPTGIPTPFHLCWVYMTSGKVAQNVDVIDWESIYKHLPLMTADELVGKDLPRWREEFDHPYLDEYWKEMCYQTRFNEIDLPVLHISGWYDDEQIGTPLNFQGMTEQGKTEFARKNQKMIMGPWPHQVNKSTTLGEIDFGPDSVIDLNGYMVRWFNYWLKDEQNGVMAEPPINLFVMGENVWRKENEWPLKRTDWTKYYIHSKGRANSRFGDGVLSTDKPTSDEGTHDEYTYNPEDPFPFISEPTSSQIGGPDNYSAVERRDDVLVYTTSLLEEDTEVTGPVKMELFAESDAVDTDFMVKLLDVHPNGFAQRLTDGMVRARFREGMESPSLIEPGKVYQYLVDCWNTSHVFKKGHKIRIEVTSSAFPKYDRNLNTGEELGKSTRMVEAHQKIYHTEQYPSAIILPVIPRG
ncbi:CocE/NonD family hydrolase [Cytobacillus sp. FJAT-54145]|uniref:CocE/NonD family hydrolase n=1 Tax=Cytobacillus spartinae TaxID=3299023 RepID=A0ABW6KAB6_9BACI